MTEVKNNDAVMEQPVNELLKIQPHKVSRDLRGYSIFFYGSPKSGKTTIASKFPNALLLAFEKGYNAIPGVRPQPINSWAQFKKTLIDLNDEQVKQTFSTIVMDTADIAYSYCEDYINNNENVSNIADIPFGKGYKMCEEEFDQCIRKILQLDYGLVIISHSQEKTFVNKDGVEYPKIVPTLDKRANKICTRTCDIIGFSDSIDTDKGTVTKLYMRGTPRYTAGSRFKYTPDEIDFTYENLVDAIGKAIDDQAKENNGELVTDGKEQLSLEEESYDFDELIKDFNELVGRLLAEDKKNSVKIITCVEKILGIGKKVMECSPAQAGQINLINYSLQKLLK